MYIEHSVWSLFSLQGFVGLNIRLCLHLTFVKLCLKNMYREYRQRRFYCRNITRLMLHVSFTPQLTYYNCHVITRPSTRHQLSRSILEPPSKHKCSPNIGLMLAHRLRRWPNIKPTSVNVFAGWNITTRLIHNTRRGVYNWL